VCRESAVALSPPAEGPEVLLDSPWKGRPVYQMSFNMSMPADDMRIIIKHDCLEQITFLGTQDDEEQLPHMKLWHMRQGLLYQRETKPITTFEFARLKLALLAADYFPENSQKGRWSLPFLTGRPFAAAKYEK
jgi:hypothetical protein